MFRSFHRTVRSLDAKSGRALQMMRILKRALQNPATGNPVLTDTARSDCPFPGLTRPENGTD